jgi:transcriptional regulator with XRE-family HTH domain
MDTAPLVTAAIEAVGPRLRRLRSRNGLSLSRLAESTGISSSTLSRLETGQRRASLELLLPLARVYGIPLDDLVGAPEVGDPRVRLRPRRVNNRTVIPLTPNPGGIQAWKIVIPGRQTVPEPRVHEGYEWLYVLSGRVRLILGERDLALGAGEVAEFDTRLPHWFGSADGKTAEVLSLFGRQGESAHVRATSAAPRTE